MSFQKEFLTTSQYDRKPVEILPEQYENVFKALLVHPPQIKANGDLGNGRESWLIYLPPMPGRNADEALVLSHSKDASEPALKLWGDAVKWVAGQLPEDHFAGRRAETFAQGLEDQYALVSKQIAFCKRQLTSSLHAELLARISEVESVLGSLESTDALPDPLRAGILLRGHESEVQRISKMDDRTWVARFNAR